MHDPLPLYLAGILALGIAAQWLAWRIRVPAIVLLLGAGFAARLLLGPPERYIPERLLFPLVSLSVGVILFEGGLSLRFRDIRGTSGVVFRLVTLGLAATWLTAGLAAYWILGFSVELAALLGALLTVSGPTVILPLLRQIQLAKRIGSVIKWEGIVNDPIGAVLAALVFKVIVLGSETSPGVFARGEWVGDLFATLLVGLGLGAAAALLILLLLRRFWIPDYLQNPVILAIVVMLFAVSNALQRESGLVTVTLLGVILANQQTVALKHVVEFKENLRVLLIGTLFIVLAANVDVSWPRWEPIAWRVAAFVAVLILVVRPLATLVSTIGSELRWAERMLLAWAHPRGIVAAAVASLLSIELSGTRFAAQSETFVLVTFATIVATVTVYGLTLGPLARRLGLAVLDPQGVVFVGASPLARAIAEAVQGEGISTLLVDTNQQNISAARMAGLPTCFASVGSEYVQEETDFGDLGRLVAVTPNDEVNTLAAMEFAERFGRAEVYQLAAPEPTSQRTDSTAPGRRGRTLFRADATFDMLHARWDAGARIKKTPITADFTIDDFRARYGSSAILLMVVDEAGKLTILTTGSPRPIKPGQKVIALVDAAPASSER